MRKTIYPPLLGAAVFGVTGGNASGVSYADSSFQGLSPVAEPLEWR